VLALTAPRDIDLVARVFFRPRDEIDVAS